MEVRWLELQQPLWARGMAWSRGQQRSVLAGGLDCPLEADAGEKSQEARDEAASPPRSLPK